MRRKAATPAPGVWEQRAPERSLMLWMALAMLVGFLVVLGTRAGQGDPPKARDLLPPLVYAGTLGFAHLVLVLSRFRGDLSLVCAPMFLSGLGILAQFRMGILYAGDSAWNLRDLLFPLGVALMLGCVLLFRGGRLASLRPFYLLAGLGSLALVGAVLATGTRFRGAVFASGNLTPTEGLKILAVFAAAGALHRRLDAVEGGLLRSLHALVPFGIFWAALVALLAVQRDLGMALILSLALLGMLVFASGRMSWILLAVAGLVVVTIIAGDQIAHSQRRMEAWLDPFADPTGSGWQTLQGLSAMFAGGLWGAGFGLGRPDRIPIAESDFIYAVIGEEFGFTGCILVVATYLVLVLRGLRVARAAADPFVSILAAGFTLVIAVQTLVNIGGVTKALPLTGVTLPFVSLGGSSMITSFIAVGLILAASEGTTSKRHTSGKPGK